MNVVLKQVGKPPFWRARADPPRRDSGEGTSR